MGEIFLIQMSIPFLEKLLENGLGAAIFFCIYPEYASHLTKESAGRGIHKKLYLCIAGLIGYSALQSWNITSEWNRMAWFCEILISPLILSVILKMTGKISFSRAVFWEYFYGSGLSLLWIFCNILAGFFWNLLDHSPFSEAFPAIMDGIYDLSMERICMGILLVFLTVCFFRKRKQQKKLWEAAVHFRYGTAVILLGLNLLVCLYFFYGQDFFSDSWLRSSLFRIWAVLFMVGVNAGIVSMKMKWFRLRLEMTERQNRLMQQEMSRSQYLHLKEQYDSSRKLLHNRRYELLHLCGLLHNGDTGAAAEYVDRLLEENGSLRRKNQIWTGRPEVDFLISHAKNQCEQNGISFQLDLELYDIPVEDTDFYVILGNLLDNGIEAAGKCKRENAFLYLRMKNASGMILINLFNSYEIEPIQEPDGRFRSSREGEEHGWGIEVVRDLVQKYDGFMEIRYGDGTFQVEILM